jgi:hypothetical protein
MSTDFKEILNNIQPLYDEIRSKYSKSYLLGSYWYVGDDLNKWWENCNNIRYFERNRKKIIDILEIILINNKNNKPFVISTLVKLLL